MRILGTGTVNTYLHNVHIYVHCTVYTYSHVQCIIHTINTLSAQICTVLYICSVNTLPEQFQGTNIQRIYFKYITCTNICMLYKCTGTSTYCKYITCTNLLSPVVYSVHTCCIDTFPAQTTVNLYSVHTVL